MQLCIMHSFDKFLLQRHFSHLLSRLVLQKDS
jgi:hypothetical protein